MSLCLEEALTTLCAFSAVLGCPPVPGRERTGKGAWARFLGQLTPEQDQAAAALLKYQIGALAATTAFG
jgi:hypothetical protein